MKKIKTWVKYQFRKLKLPKAAARINNQVFGAKVDSDISEHLSNLYNVCLAKRPNSILELGTRGGESTRVFIKYCEDFQKIGMSIDLDPCPQWMESRKWNHYVGDDIEIGKVVTSSGKWPDGSPFSNIDLIFLDSSHEYEHTLRELELYFPLISPKGILILHDTNLQNQVTRKLSGKVNFGWNNDRGVSRAIEDYFKISLDWDELVSKDFRFMGEDKISIVHYPWNNRFTVIHK